MPHFTYFILILALAIPGPALAQSSVEMERCILAGPLNVQHVKARCGTLTVPENPAEPQGRRIELFFAVLPALSPNAAPDPVVLLAGGPGQAATEAYVPLLSSLDEINQKRDIVLLDQRGTGRSHPLDCPVDPEEMYTAEFTEALVKEQTRECLENLENTDPRFYTTPIAMDDLDRLRAALGYEKLNLIGVSYGTRAAQVYLRRHPEHVRSVVLAGVVPMQAYLGLAHARHLDRAVKAVFERCAQVPACAAAFPHPWDSLQNLLHTLAADPAQVRLRHPRTAEAMEIPFSRQALAGAIRMLTYTPESQALLPLLVHDAAAGGRYARLAAQALMVSESLLGSLSRGMELSVLCAEDAPFYPENWRAPADSVLGEALVKGALWACEVWPQGEVPRGYHEPVESDVPVLLLSGEFDPVTPPAFAEQAMAAFSNARHLVVPGQAHALLARGCIPEVVTEFIARGAVENLDTQCIERMGPFPFFVDFTGPAP